jgi:hypothetical protein
MGVVFGGEDVFFLLQVKSKAARKITFEQFITALRLVASTKVGRVPRVRIPDVLTCYTQILSQYPGSPEDAYNTLVTVILGSHGPKVASKTPVDVSGICMLGRWYKKLVCDALHRARLVCRLKTYRLGFVYGCAQGKIR